MRSTWIGPRRVVAAMLVAGACGGGQKDVVPKLPGEGSEHTAAPSGSAIDEADLWAGKDLIGPPAPVAPQPIALPPVERFALANGLQVLAVESRTAPTFSIQLAVKSGRRSDPRDKVGLSSFVASMLPKGARGRSGAQLAAGLEQAGAQLNSNASFEALLVTCQGPASGQATCLKTVADVAAAPSFPAAAMSEVREQLNAAARQNVIDPAQLANVQFQNTLWGDEHIRGGSLSERAIGAIQRADLVAWQRANLTPKNAVLLVVSGRPPAALRPALEASFGRWRGPEPAATAEQPVPPPPKGIRIRLIEQPGAKTAQVRVGHLGLSHRDRDFFAATVVNHVLGGGGEHSRLGRLVRKTFAGQAAVTTSFDRNLDRGAFVAAGVAPTAQAVPLMRMMMEQIGLMAGQGPREDEVRSAVAELTGDYATRLSSNVEIAGALLAADLHGLGPDYVRNFAVELAEVNAASARASAARWLSSKDLVVVLVGNGQELEAQLVQAGLHYDKVGAAAAPDRSGTGAPTAAAPEDPKKAAAARAILDGALAAKGGAGKIAALKSLSWKGKATLNLPGGQVPALVEKRFVTPDKLRLDMVIESSGAKMSITTVLAGDKGWAQESRPDGTNTLDFPASEIEAGKAQIWRDQDFVLLRHREKGARATTLDDVELEGVAHHAVRITAPDGKRTVTLYIDKKRKRLVGMAYSEQGMSAEESFGDYKAVNGVEVAHTRKTKSAQVDLTTTVTSVAVNPSIDPAIFARPTPAATPGAGGATPGAATPGAGAATPGAKPGAGAATPGAGAATPGAKPGAGAATPGAGAPTPGAGAATPGAKPGAGAATPGAKPGAGAATPGAKPGAGAAMPGAKPGAGATTPGAGAATPGAKPGRETPGSGAANPSKPGATPAGGAK